MTPSDCSSFCSVSFAGKCLLSAEDVFSDILYQLPDSVSVASRSGKAKGVNSDPGFCSISTDQAAVMMPFDYPMAALFGRTLKNNDIAHLRCLPLVIQICHGGSASRLCGVMQDSEALKCPNGLFAEEVGPFFLLHFCNYFIPEDDLDADMIKQARKGPDITAKATRSSR